MAKPSIVAQGTQPAWSADGTQIAFNSYSYDSDKLCCAVFAVQADGTGLRQLSHPVRAVTWPSEADYMPQWSRTGDVVAFVRERRRSIDQGSVLVDDAEIRTVGVAGGGETTLAKWPGSEDFNMMISAMDWSPDGEKLAVLLDSTDHGQQLAFVGAGGGVRVVRNDFNYSNISWAPDGSRLAATRAGSSRVDLFDANGQSAGSLDVADGAPLYGVKFLPDGGRLMVEACTQTCSWRVLRVPDETLAFDPREPDERTLPLPGPAPGLNQFDWQPTTPPIIFLHGIMGSKMKCKDGRQVWPVTKLSVTALLDLRLDTDGEHNIPGLCQPRPTELLERAFGLPFAPFDIYASTMKKLKDLAERNTVAPGRVVALAWDWRRDPGEQLEALKALIKEELDADLPHRQGLKRVVLVGHSFGGLFIRAALNDPALADKIQRVLTIGTPYWGAPKSIFPLCCGVTSPYNELFDRFLLWPSYLQQLAQTLTGNFFLFPSERYGQWLTVDGKALSTQQVGAYVTSLGGQSDLYDRALKAHRQKLDGFKDLDPLALRDVRAVVGTGLPTFGAVRLDERAGTAEPTPVTGDGTVPARSGAQGTVGTTDPLGDNIPISYVCGVAHVPLPGSDRVLDAFGDYIRWGTPPRKTSAPCPLPPGTIYEVAPVTIGARTAALPRRPLTGGLPPATLRALLRAERNGVEFLPFGRMAAVMVTARTSSLTMPAKGLVVTARSFGSNGGLGARLRYGPFTGKLTLAATRTGKAQVKVNGKPRKPHRARRRSTHRP